jgi:methionine sulfoxide reductase heme-binding subunit
VTATAPDRTLAWTAPALAVMVLAILAVQGAGEPGVRMAVRATARTSAALLCLALASHAFADGHALVRRRAGLVRSLAASHGLHLLVVLRLAWLTSGETLRARSSALTVAGGVLAYAVLAAAFFRPDDRWVDRGLLWVWVVFLAAYAPRALRQPLFYGPFVGALVIALALRVAGALARRPAAVAVPREDLAT